MRSTTSDVVFGYMLEAKKIRTKIIPGVMLIVVVIGIYIWWDKKQYNQCKSLLSLLSEEYSSTMVTLNRDRIIDCYQRVYGIDLTDRGSKSTSTPAPLKPDKEVYTIGEKITYGYLTVQVKSIKHVGSDLTGLDVYVYNGKDNPRDIYISEQQFFLETPDKIRIPPTQTTFLGKHLKPDEGYNGTIYFYNSSFKQQSNLLKMAPFEGSPTLTINLNI